MKTKLVRIRKKEGYTKQALATAAAVCVATITNAENGKPVREETMARICRGLNRLIQQRDGERDRYEIRDLFPGWQL